MTAIKICVIAIYLPIYIFAWRRILRRCAREGGIKSPMDLLLALSLATIGGLIVPALFVLFRVTEVIDDLFGSADTERIVKVLAGEDEQMKSARLHTLASTIAQLEREHGLGPYA